jgi:hypothetical protein
MNELFFTRLPSFLEGNPLLESLDRDIILTILNSPKAQKRISLESLSTRFSLYSGEKVRRNKIRYSLLKLSFMGLITCETVLVKGQIATNKYSFNSDTSKWVLYTSLRALLNLEEQKRDIPPSSNSRDFKDHYYWVWHFEQSIAGSYRRFLLPNDSFKKGMATKLNQISAQVEMIVRQQANLPLTDQPLVSLMELMTKNKETHG